MKVPGAFIPLNEDEYSVREITKIVAEFYGIRIKGDEAAQKTYKAMTRRIRQALKEIDDRAGIEDIVKSSSRKKTRNNKYPTILVDKVINGSLQSYFARKAPGWKKRVYRDWGQKAARYRAMRANSQYQQEEQEYYETEFSKPPSDSGRTPDAEGERRLYKAIQDYKQEILMDIVFNHIVKLDEALLEHDVAVGLTFWENNFPEGEDIQAIERLNTPHNYYTFRKSKPDE